MPSLLMRLQQTAEPGDVPMNTLGSLVHASWKFAQGGFDRTLLLFDRANHLERPASEIFAEHEGSWFVQTGCLPYDACVKGVCLHRNGKLMVELDQLDFAQMSSRLLSAPRLSGVAVVGKQIKYQGDNLLTTVTKRAGKHAVARRTLVVTADVLTKQADPSIIAGVLDLIYGYNCFAIQPTTSEPVAPEQAAQPAETALRQKVELAQKIQNEQQMKLVNSARVLPQMVLTRQVLQMRNEELQQMVAEASDEMLVVLDRAAKNLWVQSVRRIQTAARASNRHLTFDQAAQLRRKLFRRPR